MIWYFKVGVTKAVIKSKKSKKDLGLIKDKLGEKLMAEFEGLRAKTYSYLTYNNHKSKKSKRYTKLFNKKKP